MTDKMVSLGFATLKMILTCDSSFLLLLFIGHFGLITSAADWSYDETSPVGPSNWGNSYGICKKDRQSPVDIVVSQCVSFSPPKFAFSKGYSEAADEGHKLKNNGHTIQLTMGSQNKTLSGGGLSSTYRLVQLHMHWGSTDKAGSEHLLDGKTYPLEIHLVHYNEAFPNIDAAITNETGLAVLGIFAEVGLTENTQLQSIIQNLSSVKYAGTEVVFNEKIKIIDLLPKDRKSFFRYQGSLTTPPCFESVTWTVFQEPITISSNQVKELRKVFHNKAGDHDAPLVDNYRPVQNLNSRNIQKSLTKDISNSGNTLFTSLAVPLSIMALMFGLLRS